MKQERFRSGFGHLYSYEKYQYYYFKLTFSNNTTLQSC